MIKDYRVRVRLDVFEGDCFSIEDGVVEVDLCVAGVDAPTALESAAHALSDLTHFVFVVED